MDAAGWERVQAVFHAALEVADADRRELVHRACGGDADLEAAVLGLLEEDGRGGSLLDQDVAQVAQRVLEPATDELPFTHVGKYAIKRRLGEGGMGVVYLAEREDLGSLVAVKLLRDAWVSPARRERFASEQRTLAQLNHPSIARLYDADTLADGTPWFAMEYVEGVSLTEHCSGDASPLADRLRLFREVCEAVQYAHQHLIVHRDLKPSNILVTADGRVKLLDFGIAKQIESVETPADQTQTMFRLMTPSYAAPEQIRGQRVGIHTDVYSLGVVLYELLAGRRPFDLSHRTPGEAESIVLEQQPERPSAACRTSAGPVVASRSSWADLDVLCLTAMHKDPQRRYPTVEALIRDLDRYRTGKPLQARADSLAYRTRKFVTRHRWAVLAAGVALAVVSGLTVLYTLGLAAARSAALTEAARTERVQQFMLRLFEGGEHDAAPAADLRVVTLIDRGEREARVLSGDPAIQAELYQTLGTIYQRLGSYDKADTLLRSSLDTRRRSRAGAADVAESLVALGLLRVEQAKLEEGERLIREGLAAASALPEGHPSFARATAALGKVLRERGAYQEAIQVLERAVGLYSTGPSSTPELAANLTSLANAHFYVGHLDQSETLNRRVLELDRRLYGGQHPSVADDLLNLGAIESLRGRYASAEGYSRQALAIIQAWYGDDHPETASAQTILAQSLMYQAKYDEAAVLLRQALATQERAYGQTHPRVAFALNELGSVALRRGDLDEADAAFRRAVVIYRSVYGGKHYRVGVALVNLASVHAARRDIRGAQSLFEEALALYAEVLPPGHQNIGIAHIKLGQALVHEQRYADAEPHLAAGYQILLKQTAPPPAWLEAARKELATVYEAAGERERAASLRAELAAAAQQAAR